MVGGGLMQLIAYGAQDIYLTSNYSDNYSDYDSDYDSDDNLHQNMNNLQIDTKNWYQFDRPIKATDKNNECPITLEKIGPNESYCICAECNYIFNAEELKKALKTHNECPMCLSEWKSTIEYVNK